MAGPELINLPTFKQFRHTLKGIYELLNTQQRHKLLFSVCLVALSSILSASTIILLAWILEDTQAATVDIHSIVWLMLAFVLAKAFSHLIGSVRWLFFNPVAYDAMYGLSIKIAVAAAKRAVTLRGREDVGQVGELLGRIAKAQTGAMAILYQLLIGLLPIVIEIIFVGIAVAVLLGWHAPIVIALSALSYVFFMLLGRDAEARAFAQANLKDNQVSKALAELSGNARLMEEYQAQSFFSQRVQTATQISVETHRQFFKIKVWRGALVATGLIITYGVAMLYAYFFIQSGNGGVGAVFLAITFVDRILSPLNTVTGAISGIRSALIELKVCDELGVFSKTQPKNHIQPQHITSSLSMVLKNGEQLNFDTGKTVLVGGHSGAGKSSFLCQVYEAIAHHQPLQVGHLSNNELNSCVAAQQVCYLSNSTVLIPGTIRDNILLGAEDVSEQTLLQVWQGVWASSRQHQHSLSLELSSADLSAGERQRVCLTRALLHRPQVLILDEASNGLDLDSEQAVWCFIRDWIPNALIFVAAHRVDTFSNADYRLTIAEGQIMHYEQNAMLQTV